MILLRNFVLIEIFRYRKYNLYAEPYFTRPNQPEEVTFETEFGVTFGIFTCFDIIFENPALKLVQKNITHFVYPTAWVSEMPFFTGNYKNITNHALQNTYHTLLTRYSMAI